MMVQELGITFPGSLDLAGDVPFSSVLDDGMGFAALANVPTLGLAQVSRRLMTNFSMSRFLPKDSFV